MDLLDAARARGIQTEYSDVFGELRRPKPQVLERILAALGESAAPPESGGEDYPTRVWSPGPQRCAGIAIALYGLRSSRNWGCGDFRDLRDFVEWAARETGAAFVALNPLHAIANRLPYNTSPYLPLSSFYRNFLYLDVEQIPEAREFLPPRESLEELRASEFVEYEKIAALKLSVLRRAYEKWSGGADFDRYTAEQGEPLLDYALFCALDEKFRRERPGTWLWTAWPPEYQDSRSTVCREFAESHIRELDFFRWLQWWIDRQLADVQAYTRQLGMPVGLVHDLALATDRYGCDFWAYRDFFVSGARVGAPPDAFSPDGQDWSFPPPNKDRHRADGYKLFAASIRQNARHGGALRLDHVMRLLRLYWIPDGFTPRDGVYVAENWRDLFGVLARESHHLRVRIIGEDLGTITGEMRQTLDSYGLLGYRVLYFERNGGGEFRPPEEYPTQAVATVTTHDLATLAGFWVAADIEARRGANLIGGEDYERQISERRRDRQYLLDRLRQSQLLPPDFPADAELVPEFTEELHRAVIGFLATTPCEWFVVNQEDLTGEIRQQNLPGSTAEYPNWRRKMKFSIEDLQNSPEARRCAQTMAFWVRRSGRVPER
ncbi:MAG: 4-alpha-glucanotransferase [Bryobacteraceae bacterium]|nr:4-alpha-glucanotransferase [Bryobacteraceae bacterium]